MSKFRLENRVAIVTGGAGGIGTHIAMTYAKAGASVVIASRNKENLDKVVAEIEGAGGKALSVATDITVPEQVDNLVKETVDTFGSLDILVNNAGSWGRSGLPTDLSLEQWNEVIGVCMTGTFLCSIAAGKVMIEQQRGKIINISSTAGTKGNPGVLHYSAAKAGVLSLSNNLSFMWARHNICVNAILPGLIATQMLKDYNVIPADTDKDGNPVPRLELPPDPEDVADLALFLASEASDSITGEQIPIRRWCKIDRFWE